MRGIGEHFRRYAHAVRFAIGLHGATFTNYYFTHLLNINTTIPNFKWNASQYNYKTSMVNPRSIIDVCGIFFN